MFPSNQPHDHLTGYQAVRAVDTGREKHILNGNIPFIISKVAI